MSFFLDIHSLSQPNMDINIVGSNNDPFSRYRMPSICLKIEGKNNGIKTIISNLSNIAKNLDRDPMHILKYFAYELGVQTNFKNGRYILNGKFESHILQNIIHRFIENYVTCKLCGNPETVINSYRNRNKIEIKCNSCGFSDFKHNNNKLSNYIINSSPKKTHMF